MRAADVAPLTPPTATVRRIDASIYVSMHQRPGRRPPTSGVGAQSPASKCARRRHFFAIASALVGLLAATAEPARAQQIFFDDFENAGAIDATKWTTITNATAASGTNQVFAGTYSAYFSDAAGATRALATAAVNLTGGARLTFALRYLGSSNPSITNFDKFEGSDQIDVQYWSGAAWVTFQSFAGSGTSAPYNVWATTPVTSIPSAGLIAGGRIQWIQTGGGASADQWAIDNVSITAVPEPGTWALFGVAVAGLAGIVRRRRARRATAGAASSGA